MKCKLGGYLFVRLKCFVYHGRLQFFFFVVCESYTSPACVFRVLIVVPASVVSDSG